MKKINKQKTQVHLHTLTTYNLKIKRTALLPATLKRIKCLQINSVKSIKDQRMKNCRQVKKETKKDTHKCRYKLLTDWKKCCQNVYTNKSDLQILCHLC